MSDKKTDTAKPLDISTEAGLLPAVGAVTLACLLGALGLVAGGGWSWLSAFLNSQAANWIQAFATFFGLMAAYQMARAQIKADRQLEEERRSAEYLRWLAVIDALLEQAERAIEMPLSQARGNNIVILNYWQFPAQRAFANVKKIDLFDCPSAKLVSPLAMLPMMLETLEMSADDYYKVMGDNYDENEAKLKRSLANSLFSVESLLKWARTTCRDESARLAA